MTSLRPDLTSMSNWAAVSGQCVRPPPGRSGCAPLRGGSQNRPPPGHDLPHPPPRRLLFGDKGRPEVGTGVLERVMREMNRRTDVGVRWSLPGARAVLMAKLGRKYRHRQWAPTRNPPPHQLGGSPSWLEAMSIRRLTTRISLVGDPYRLTRALTFAGIPYLRVRFGLPRELTFRPPAMSRAASARETGPHGR